MDAGYQSIDYKGTKVGGIGGNGASTSQINFRGTEDLGGGLKANFMLESFLRLDREFHLLSYAGAQAGMLSEFVERIWNTTQHYRRAFAKLNYSSNSEVTHMEHKLILDGILRKDSIEAGRALEGHIRRTRVTLAEHKELFSN